MTSLKNVLEEIVITSVQEQIKHVGDPTRPAENLSEVAAFALNRLPALYASTSRGWLQQRKRAHNELQHRISATVQQALLGVKRDPLRTSTLIAASKIETPAHILTRLQKLFSKTSLQWRDVPTAFQEALVLVSSSPDYRALSMNDRTRLREIKSYLHRKENHHHIDPDWQS